MKNFSNYKNLAEKLHVSNFIIKTPGSKYVCNSHEFEKVLSMVEKNFPVILDHVEFAFDVMTVVFDYELPF